MKKRILSILLLLCMIITGLSAEVEAATSLPDEIYLTQEDSGNCTLAASAMMIRARLFLSGNEAWKTTIEGTIRPSAWITNTGLKWNWTYSFSGGSISVARKSSSGISISKLKSVLDAHPEGIVLYCGNYPHAVFVTDYEGDTFYCADSGSTKYPRQRIKLVDGVMKKRYTTQAKVLSNVTAYWYVSSYSITPTDVVANIGEDFYAVIKNTANGKPITLQENESVCLGTEEGIAEQVWRFELQSDGSYKISSALTGRSLSESSNNILTQEDSGENNQRWFVYKRDNGYILKSKYSDSANNVLTLQKNNSADGTAVITAAKDYSASQIWTIYQGEDILLSAPVLEVVPGNSSVQTTFDWAEVYGEDQYDVKIWKEQVDENEPYILKEDVEPGQGVLLEPGTYQAYVEAFNYYGNEKSNTVTFVIEEGEGLMGDVNADGAVDTSDAQAIFNHFMGSQLIEGEEMLRRADVNQDGSIDTSDAQAAFNIFMNV